jgi:hypothetical protein
LYTGYQKSVKAAHFAFIPFLQPSTAQIATENITLTPFEQEGFNRTQTFLTSGTGYRLEQSSRPNTIGLALLDSPVGQLAWLAEKFVAWSDPDRSPPSTITNDTILTSVSLYYHTRSFFSSVWIYSRDSMRTNYNVARPSAPMGFSAFRFNIAQWPEKFIAKVGNLTVYNGMYFTTVSRADCSSSKCRARPRRPLPRLGQPYRAGRRHSRASRVLEAIDTLRIARRRLHVVRMPAR